MKYILYTLFLTVQIAYTQILPDRTYRLEDTLSSIYIGDFYLDENENIFLAGQKLTENSRLFFLTAFSKNSAKLFETTIPGQFETEGQFIVPVNESTFAVTGISEDNTGTFNFRTAKIRTDGNIEWEKIFGEDSLMLMDEPADIEVDSKGNIIVAGSSYSFEQYYTLVQYSSTGKLNWSVRHKPFKDGSFTVRDIITDSNDNIYGITRNTFTSDTSHGTIFKRSKDGVLLWEKSFDVYFPEDPSEHLLLLSDTLYVAGSLFTEGSVNDVIVFLSLTADGNVVSFKRFSVPGNVVQQNVRDLKAVSDNMLALANESYWAGTYYLHTFLLSKDFKILQSDSLVSTSSLKAKIVNETQGKQFSVYAHGGELYKLEYSIANGNLSKQVKTFNTEGELVHRIKLNDKHLFALSADTGFPVSSSTIRRYSFETTDVAEDNNAHPNTVLLYPAYPNPFNPVTKIKYSVPVGAYSNTPLHNILLKVYDILGNEVTTLVNEEQPAGDYEVEFSAYGLPSGIYYYQLRAGEFIQTKKMVLIK